MDSVYDAAVRLPEPKSIDFPGRHKSKDAGPPKEVNRLQQEKEFPLILPPKRYEDASNPKFDSIRHYPWFKKLDRRRDKIPLLDMALRELNHGAKQVDAAKHWDVDERELRDYANFVRNFSPEWKDNDEKRLFQFYIDQAYRLYTHGGGWTSFRRCITVACSHSTQGRHVTERWEVDPNFWPTNYDRSLSNK